MTTAMTTIAGGFIAAFLFGYGVGFLLRAALRLIEGIFNSD